MQTPPPGPPIGPDDSTYQFILRVFGVAVSAVLLMIVGVLCYRVAADGNSAVTVQITQQLATTVPWLAGAMVAAIVGAKALAGWITTKLP